MKSSLDIAKVRRDFPMLSQKMNGHPLAYLDNAASTQKPKAVIDRLTRFLSNEYANIHRGVYPFSHEATEFCEATREKCRAFLNAASKDEIVFVRGATEAINLVAASYGRGHLKKDDEILVSEIEHHANIVPWQRLCEEKGLKLKVIPVNDRGELDMDAFRALLGARTYLVSVTQVSNALGTVNPVEEIVKMAHHAGAAVMIDGAQSAPHMAVDVKKMDCDFFCFSAHKVYGPTGIGVLYAKKKHLETMEPYQSGGDMIEWVTFEKTTYAKPPAKFEAGTPAIAEIVALGPALDYIQALGFDAIAKQEHALLEHATRSLTKIPGLRIIGQALDKASLVSFDVEGIHPHDMGTVLSECGVAVRAGHHCAQPTMKRFGVNATTRASFAFYNTLDEVDALVSGVERALKVFR